ncbi:MAG: glycosyltransferase family 2 protein [Candidatus Sumerlaeaceae bacterium]|nr:glycosyltransferase family 2 protein [Candidatus Sumerlaeaceae bacterium]
MPKLSVVIPARNEEKVIRDCLLSLLAQDYPNLEIIAVNDRSTDSTGAIMDQVAVESGGRVVVQHITELPDGWLGKCNALSEGATKATGEFILFTDGDILFDPSTLERAMGHAVREDADLVVVLPTLITTSVMEQGMLLAFAQAFMIKCAPWRAMDRRSTAFLGVGAFNMIRASFYRRIGGHRFLKLQVVDDVGLGKIAKQAGGRIRPIFGENMVRVRWQDSLGGHIRGLEKNGFASMNYSVVKSVVGMLGLLAIYWWPLAGLFFGPLGPRIICGVTALAFWGVIAPATGRRGGYSPLAGLLTPVGGLFMVVALGLSMATTLRIGGVRWRDHFYPLRELRKYRL